jgi:hypothetical protein
MHKQVLDHRTDKEQGSKIETIFSFKTLMVGKEALLPKSDDQSDGPVLLGKRLSRLGFTA